MPSGKSKQIEKKNFNLLLIIFKCPLDATGAGDRQAGLAGATTSACAESHGLPTSPPRRRDPSQQGCRRDPRPARRSQQSLPETSASSQAFPRPHHAGSESPSVSPEPPRRTHDSGLELPQFLQNKPNVSPSTLAKLPQLYTKTKESSSPRPMPTNSSGFGDFHQARPDLPSRQQELKATAGPMVGSARLFRGWCSS